MTDTPSPVLTVFILVRSRRAWLDLSAEARTTAWAETCAPLLARYANKVRTRFYDAEFYNARFTDVWMFEVEEVRAYEALIEDLRDTPLWDVWFDILEILASVENPVSAATRAAA